MQTVVGVGFNIPSKDNDYIKFDSVGSLSDADIVLFDPSINKTYYPSYEDKTYSGKTLYSMERSLKIKEHCAHWRSEILNLLNIGKTVFILMAEKSNFYIHTGKKETSGTGRSQTVSDLIDPWDNYKFFTIPGIEVNNASGSNIYVSSPIVKNLHDCCNGIFQFQSYIKANEEIKSQQLFTTKNKDKTLGILFKHLNGHVLFIPAIRFPNNFTTPNGNWTDKALIYGKNLKRSLVEIADYLKVDSSKTPNPDWVNNTHFQINKSEDIQRKIQAKIDAIKTIEDDILSLNESLKEQDSLKDLLFETGKPLEAAVIKALKLIGYQTENYDDGILELDQVIISPEGDRFIGECEGKDNKDIDITKFRQLQDALNEDLAREEVEEKALAILFGNPQRLTMPNERTLDFTIKCKKAAEREQVALIKTSDLFMVARYLSENDDESFKLECRNVIKSQLGKVVEFPILNQ